MTRILKPPYTSANDIDAFFERIRTIGEPKTITSDWIKSYNLANSQPEGILSMLKWLGVLDEKGESAGVWNKIRVEATRQEELARLVRAAYSKIFDAVDVSSAPKTDLEGAFITEYDAGAPGRLVNCFLALCRHAGIDTAVATRRVARAATPSGSQASRPTTPATATNGGEQRVPKRQERRSRAAVTTPSGPTDITLNIEIPAEWTEDQIRERIAAVMRALGPADAGDS